MLHLLPAVAALLAAAPIPVAGGSDCPAPELVAASLAPLALPASAAGDRARVDAVAGGVAIRLLDAEGRTLAERTLETDAPCEDRARAVAAILAAWEAQLRGSEQSAEQSGRHVLPGHSSLVPPSTAPAAAVDWALDLGVGASLADSLSGSALIAASVAPAGGRFGGRLELTSAMPRSQRLGPGRYTWLRAGGALGPVVRAAFEPVRLDFWLGVQAAFMEVHGEGYAANQSTTGFDAGFRGGIRVAWPRGPWGVFAEFGLGGWLQRDRVLVDGSRAVAALPVLEGRATIGGTFGRP